MYESLLQSSFLIRLLASVVPALIVVVPLTLESRKQTRINRDENNVMTTAMSFVGAAFIFIGSFANVTAWQGESSANSSLKIELASLSALSETILDYKTEPVLQDAMLKITTYVQTIHDTELSPSGIRGFMQDSTKLKRKQRTKNAALGAVAEVQRDSPEQLALDIRSAVISIEEANVVNGRDLTRMLQQVDDFQTARHNRLSGTWPLVPQVVIGTFFIITLAVLVLISRYPTGSSRELKWMHVFTSMAVVSAVWFSVLSTQDVSVNSSRFNGPIESFLVRYK
jgi:hypothetical protein